MAPEYQSTGAVPARVAEPESSRYNKDSPTKIPMSSPVQSSLTANLQSAAGQAGLAVLGIEAGTDFNGHPTTRFRLGSTPDAPADRTLQLELSEAFDFHKPE